MGAPTRWIKIMITAVSAVICHTNQPDLYLELNLWWEQEVNPLTEQNLTEWVPLMIGLSEVDKMYFVYYICALLCGCKCYLVGNKEYGMFNNVKHLRHVNIWIIMFWEFQIMLTQYSVEIWLAVQHSADWLILQNNEKATLNINMPYIKNWFCTLLMFCGEYPIGFSSR